MILSVTQEHLNTRQLLNLQNSVILLTEVGVTLMVKTVLLGRTAMWRHLRKVFHFRLRGHNNCPISIVVNISFYAEPYTATLGLG